MTMKNYPARGSRAGSITHVRMDDATEDDRRVVLSFSSEMPYRREAGGEFWREVLGHGDGECDLARLNSGAAPLLKDHLRSIDNQIGVVESAKIVEGRGVAVVRFSASEEGTKLLARVRDGEVSSVSVGYDIEAIFHAGSVDGEPILRATHWRPTEISLVAIPADASVGVGRSDQPPTIPVEIKETPMAEPLKIDKDKPKTPAQVVSETPPPDADAIRAAELARMVEIDAIGERMQAPAEMIREAKSSGASLDAFRAKVMDWLPSREAEGVRTAGASIGMSEKDKRQFSFCRAINALNNPADRRAADAAGFEFEVSQEAERKLGRESRGGLVIPFDMLAWRDTRASSHVVGTPTAGGNLVDDVLMSASFIEALRARSLLDRLGITSLTGLTGSLSIPKQTSTVAAQWIGEDGEAAKSGATIGQVQMAPKTVSAFTDFSRKLVVQSSIDVEALVRSDIAKSIALAIDLAAFQAAGVNAPAGLDGLAGVHLIDFAASAQPSFPEIVEMWTAIATANADGNAMKYAMSPQIRAHMLTNTKYPAGDQPILGDSGLVNGYGHEWSNQVATGDLWFADWSQFVRGFWSGLDLTVDPYSASSTGATRVVAFQDVDFAVRHPQAFARGRFV